MIASRFPHALTMGVAIGMLALLPACGKDGASSSQSANTDTAAVSNGVAATNSQTASGSQTTTGGQTAANTPDTAGHASTITDAGLPVIVVDEAHQTASTPGNPKIPHYQMRPADGFILDASHYKYARPVNAVEILFVAGGGYIVNLDKNLTSVVIRPDMLKPLQLYNGDHSFSKGHNFQIVVGFAGPTDDHGHPSSYDPVWMANVDVQ